MPAARVRHRQPQRKTPSRRLPRITDPYAPREALETGAQTASEKREEEKLRVTANRRIVRLQKQHEKAVAGNLSIANEAAREQANLPTFMAQRLAVQEYEKLYGKFVADAENRAWFARKKPRMEELMKLRQVAEDIDRHDNIAMVVYLQRARAFEEDFGHEFCGHDGLDEHFKEMASHAHSAARLRERNSNNVEAMVAEAARPLSFEVSNPYPVGHPRRGDFDDWLRDRASSLLDAPLLAALPATVIDPFPFTVRNPYANSRRVLAGHYKLVYLRNMIQTTGLYHWEAANGCPGEGRGNTHTPFVPRPRLW
ncbi:hypothetical protein DFH06DRAFT_1351743 [Mycena polygramma]|nr:hypothetical protein DFH06DRAFT_1351743 [Mycena polygramma]